MKQESLQWFMELQKLICQTLEDLEPKAKFKDNKWKFGNFKTIKGDVIEKGGVAFSNVIGKFPKDFAKEIPGTKHSRNFWSTGVSVVLHPKNPKVPAIHFNTRYIETEKSWFGGGADMTPCLKDDIERNLWHYRLKQLCDRHNKLYYKTYKKWCDEYFYLPHREEIRGVGGIFFDYKYGDKHFEFVKDVGRTFCQLLKEIITPKMKLKYTKQDKHTQLLKRGKYVEFNLMYDRGTKFGLQSGGNPEAILMSMPPGAIWEE